MSELQKGESLQIAVGDSSIGLVLVAASAIGLASVLLGDDADVLQDELRRRFPTATLSRGPGADEMLKWVIDYIDASTTDVDMPLDIRGTEFQRRVWLALREIP